MNISKVAANTYTPQNSCVKEPSKIIRSLRNLREFSQDALAAKAKISKSLLQKYEAGDVDPAGDKYRAVLDALDVTVEMMRRCPFDAADKAADWLFNESERLKAKVDRGADDGVNSFIVMRWFDGLRPSDQHILIEELERRRKNPPAATPADHQRIKDSIGTNLGGGRKGNQSKSG